LPVAALAGIIIGSWGSREELRAYKNLGKSGAASAVAPKKASGFDAFARMVQIPDAASRRPPKKHAEPSLIAVKRPGVPAGNSATNKVAVARRQRDLGVRIEEARDLWSARVDIARAQCKSKLKLSGESEEAFDRALQEMNERLYESVSVLADIVDEQGKLTPETGLRLVGETATVMAEAYDRIGACVSPELRGEVGEINIVDFIDPSVAEPLVGIQDRIEMPDGRTRGNGR